MSILIILESNRSWMQTTKQIKSNVNMYEYFLALQTVILMETVFIVNNSIQFGKIS